MMDMLLAVEVALCIENVAEDDDAAGEMTRELAHVLEM